MQRIHLKKIRTPEQITVIKPTQLYSLQIWISTAPFLCAINYSMKLEKRLHYNLQEHQKQICMFRNASPLIILAMTCVQVYEIPKLVYKFILRYCLAEYRYPFNNSAVANFPQVQGTIKFYAFHTVRRASLIIINRRS